MSEWTVDTLKEYVERILAERDRALEKQAVEYERRLSDLNHAHERAQEVAHTYVSADKYNYSYESFKLYVGDGKTMRQIPVIRVERYRDGGTTIIETPEQWFGSPSPFNVERDPNLVPEWGDAKLANLDVNDYDITEADGQVTITKK